MLFVGDDWAEDRYDVEIVDDSGQLLTRRRLPEGLDGVTRLHALIGEHMPGTVPHQTLMSPGGQLDRLGFCGVAGQRPMVGAVHPDDLGQ